MIKKTYAEAIAAARKELIIYDWFDGICVDRLPRGFQHNAPIVGDFDGVVETLVNETIMWDAPNDFFKQEGLN